MYTRSKKIHLVGIGGTGMCGIAEVLLNLGYSVSGSDLKETEITERLATLGGRIHLGHRPSNVEGADLVVISSAIRPDNPEFQRARTLGVPVIRRAEMLAELMRMKYGVAVAGAHGKTTTTSLVGAVLARGGLDPTVVVGGRLKALGSNARMGAGEFLVAEADESDGSFLMLSPAIAVVTNLDAEHLDFYHDMVEIRRVFVEFINHVPFYGLAVLCAEDPGVRQLLPFVKKRHVTYGLDQPADWRALEITRDGESTRFVATFHGIPFGEFSVKLFGRHNVLNALAAVAVGRELELSAAVIAAGLQEFSGVGRRFERKGEVGGVTVVDDYGHHPTEVSAVLETARTLGHQRVVAVFQPHRYTRTANHWKAFGRNMALADVSLVLPIYAAGEEELPGVSSAQIVEAARQAGAREVLGPGSLDEAGRMLAERVRPGDLVITLGAGDVWKVGEELLRKLESAPHPAA